jgi:hypothetical protein
MQVDASAALRTAGEGSVAFLSSPALLSLQLSDATFRRHLLVEIWILLERCLSYEVIRPTGMDAKFKPPAVRVVDDCKQLLPRVVECLQATDPKCGGSFTSMSLWL